MKVRLDKTSWRIAGGLVVSSILVFTFQNCGKAGFDTQTETSSSTAMTDAQLTAKYGEATAAKVEAIPFAFDSAFDTISYNSCATDGLNTDPAFFSLKAGAYSTGGIKINTAFFDYADQNFNPVYPETSLTVNQYKEFLADSPANNGTIPTMALRVKNSLTDVYVQNGSGSTVALNKDVIPMVSMLTDSLIMESVVSKGVTASYFPFSPEQKIMEGALSFNTGEGLADDFRNILMSTGVLALTYLPNNSEANAVRSSTNATKSVNSAYGKGYSMTFAPFPVAGAASSNPNHVLTQITEVDLANPTAAASSWNCHHVYAVVSTKDIQANPSLCPSMSYDTIKANASYRAELDLLRRHLPADKWDINVAAGCIVPKGNTSCYKEESINGSPVVQYDLTKECFRDNKADYANGIPNSRCMNFITVCTRN
ncbi:MAG: hypothetical protein ACXVCP_13700 [Bdellovibrio sp.]